MHRVLKVPANVSLRNEIWSGLSVRDAIVSLIVLIAVAVPLGVLSLFLPVPAIVIVFASILAGITAAGLHSRIPEANRSILDQIGIMTRFSKSQKEYRYIYGRGGKE